MKPTARTNQRITVNFKPENVFVKSLISLTGAPSKDGAPVSFVRSKANIPNVTVDQFPTQIEQHRKLYIDTKFPDSHSIISYLDKLAYAYGRSPYLREFVAKNILCVVNDNNAKKEQLLAIARATRDFILYVNDPTGSEYFISPVRMVEQMKRGMKPKGDCDDHVLFLNSCAVAVGLKARAVGVQLNRTDIFDHVVSEIQIGNEWILIDPCAKNGVRTPNYRNKLISGLVS